ncbi:MAG: TIGR02099 family protein [Chromatiaceae bacterium]|nr:TIGR02099 family protein [Chromatiaceae bacterium]
MRTLNKLLTGIVILWGLLAILVRAATPLIADYREQIAAAAAMQLGVPVTIGALHSRWYGLRPLLEFDDVTIGGADRPLRVDRVSVDLAAQDLLLGSLRDALRVTIDGMRLTLVREPSGQLHLDGVGPLASAHAADRAALALVLPKRVRLVNTRVVWVDRKTGTPPVPFDHVAASFRREGERLNLRASLHNVSGTVELAAKLNGFVTTTEWSGDTYLRIDNLDVARLFAPYLPAGYGVHGFGLDLQSWSHWQNAAPLRSQGRFQLRNLDLRPLTPGSVALQVAQAGARFTLWREAGGLRLGLKGLQFEMDGHQWPGGDLALALSPQADGGTRISAAADYLRIEDVVNILQVRMPWPALQEPLEHLAPHGEIRDLRLQADLSPDRFDWRGTARFIDLGSAPFGRFPGIDKVSGELHGQQDHLLVRLNSRDAALRFATLFRDPLELQRLRGRVDVVKSDTGWQVHSEELLAVSPHITTRTRLDFSYVPGQSPFLDLQTDFRDGDAAFAKRYYPTGIMNAGLVAWLDRAIQSGRVTQGAALVRGPLSDFPFENSRDGTFQVVFDTSELSLDYLEGWPPIEGLGAHVRFHGNQLEIDAHAGRILDSQLVETSAHIDSLRPGSGIDIRGRVVGPLNDNLRVLGEPALRERFGRFAETLRGEGRSELTLDFSLPLAGHGTQSLNGALRLADATLSLPAWDFDMADIKGQLNFTLDGLSAEGITARALGAPLVLDVQPLASGATRVRARARLAITDMARQVPALPLQFAQGKAVFAVDLDVPPARAPKDSPIVLSVDSDLKGIAIDLPPPFAKPSEAARQLTVRLPLGGHATAGSLNYADQLAAQFSGDGARVDVSLGGPAKLRAEPGIRVGGSLQELDLAAWSDVLATLPAGGAAASPLHLDLQIAEVLAYGHRIEQLQLKASRNGGLWRGSIAAADLSGRFSAAQKLTSAPLQIDLERLYLALPDADRDEHASTTPDPRSGPDPAEFPDLAIKVADLRIGEARLGQLGLRAQHAPQGLSITELSLSDGQLELAGNGYWARDGAGFRTDLQGQAESKGLGDLLVGLGYSRQVEEAPGKLQFQLQWPGSPAQFHRTTLLGKVELDLGAGRLLELDPGVTRVVGLLNLNALTRRLRLDFSDFYKKGYSFDSIKGAFSFGGGRASTEDLTVLGPTGRIEVKGSADLRAETLEQKVTVTPNIDATLPIAGTLAGGPVAGIAVLIAQKVMTKQVEKLNRFEYSLSGPWADPEIKQLGTGGTLSKIIQQFQRNDRQASESPAAEQTAASQPPPPAQQEETHPDPTAPPAEPGPTAADDTQDRQAADKSGPLRRLLNIFRQGEPQANKVPGSKE